MLKKEGKFAFNQSFHEKEFEFPEQDKKDFGDLYEAIQSLNDNYRVPIILKYLRGFSEKEIAEILDLNQNTVKTRLYKGREKLKEILTVQLKRGEQYGY
ncbi:sigma-70 family RNA polymerase sigma factor [Tepidibacillus marianensis]|uniref:RNA polymerase sigma factor n=1 Tax=Tepidibacillus marianensis TaxID=3131995 RepID=UPI00338FA874